MDRLVGAAIRKTPDAVGFFQLVRLVLNQLAANQSDPDATELLDGFVRFREEASLKFPASDVTEVDIDDERVWQITVACFGLIGPNGPMPSHYNDAIWAQLRKDRGRSALKDFLDIFTHRFATLFYLAWRRSRIEVQEDDPGGRGDDGFGAFDWRILALLGFFPPADAAPFADGELLAATHLLRFRPVSADVLEDVLEEMVGVPVAVQEMTGGWIPTSRAGSPGLGRDETIVLGNLAWVPHGEATITLGPLGLAEYETLLPGSPRTERLRELCRLAVGDHIRFWVRLAIRGDEIDGARLGAEASLGQTSWLEYDKAPVVDTQTCFLLTA